MPIKVYFNTTEKWIFPTKDWKEQSLDSAVKNFKVDENFYVYAIKKG